MEYFLIGFALFIWLIHEEARQIERKKQKAVAEAINNFNPTARLNKGRDNSAGFAEEKHIKAAGLFKGSGLRLGHFGKHVMRFAKAGHVILIAPPRSGKGVSVIIPALLEKFRGTRIIIDPKGEIYAVCAERMATFSRVVAIDPFGLCAELGRKAKRACFNVLSALNPKSISFGGDIDDYSDAIVTREVRSGDNANFFDNGAQQLISTVIRVLVKFGKPEQKNLVEVANIVSGDVYAFARQYAHCGDTFAEQGLARYAAVDAETSRSLGDIISTAISQTDFIRKEGIAQSLMADGLHVADLTRKPMTVFFILPLDKLTSCGKWFRLCMAAVLTALLKAGHGGKRGLPIQLWIDEAFSIGPLKTFQTAMSQAAGAANLTMIPILQDLNQLQTMYPGEGWKTFMSTSAVRIFFGCPGDKDTSERISALAGKKEVMRAQRTVNGSFDSSRVGWSDSMGPQWENVIEPWEVRDLPADQMLIFAEGVPGVIRATRQPYFRGWEFFGKYQPNPYYGGGFFRRMLKG